MPALAQRVSSDDVPLPARELKSSHVPTGADSQATSSSLAEAMRDDSCWGKLRSDGGDQSHQFG